MPGSTEFKLIHDLELYVRHLGPLHRGQHLFREGDPISGLLIVQSGCLKLYGVDQAGREYIPGFRLPGDTVGLHGFFTGRHQFNAVALSTSVICQIDHTHLQEIIGRIPTLMPSILRKVGQEMINSVFLSGNFTAEERVTAFLVNLHEKLQKSASSGEINLPMTRGDIAVFLHLASATVSRILSRLERNGVITTDLHHIQLLDLPRLQCLCMNVPFATQQVG
ncbi:MAG: cyclic nucleotide-binding domain-containing protein [Gammaproteobacteria bacterium]|nr:cyclic nucleotide-binding domain-containing protein [Gammaproteobacteria bacterium]MDE2345806.1 cyclic nucleotide-binding domain-containing protein [Gammaproteobacteria bacterium]